MTDIYNLQRIIGMRGTKANVEALTATLEEQAIAYASDTGEVGIYTNGAWEWITTALDLDDLGDVTITSAANGQIIKHNGAAWVNVTPAWVGEILIEDGSSAPPIMLTNEAEDDFLYED